MCLHMTQGGRNIIWQVSQPGRALCLRNTNKITVFYASASRHGVIRELLWVMITKFERPSTDQVKKDKTGIPNKGGDMSKEWEA